ncbi:MAG: PilZ domain-containing protein [Bdellovibrionales bacterium]|nr:PilZ domain-containing protein [Bdellovibrionales bacterium]
MIAKRSDDYRYTVDLVGADITPLAAVEAFVGPHKVQVRNISQGGVALSFAETPPFQLGDVADISIAIRERHFPVQIEIKGTYLNRLNCAFVSAPAAFQSALQEFLQPKYLGATLQLSAALSERPGATELVEGAVHYRAYVGQNQVAIFTWTNAEGDLLKLVAMSRELVFEWSNDGGAKTGRLTSRLPTNDIQWHKEPDAAFGHYFADVLIAWFKSDEGSKLVERLMAGAPLAAGERLRLPEI